MSLGTGGHKGPPRRAGEAGTVDEAVDVLRALANPVRLRIIELLVGGELCVKRLEELLGVSQSSVSQHLSRLRYAGLIESERRGHLVCYKLSDVRAVEILRAISREDEQRPRRTKEEEENDG